jgi:hypothetical protein
VIEVSAELGNQAVPQEASRKGCSRLIRERGRLNRTSWHQYRSIYLFGGVSWAAKAAFLPFAGADLIVRISATVAATCVFEILLVVSAFCRNALFVLYGGIAAGVAQLVEHLICNQRVGGSSPFAGSTRHLKQCRGGRVVNGTGL